VTVTANITPIATNWAEFKKVIRDIFLTTRLRGFYMPRENVGKIISIKVAGGFEQPPSTGYPHVHLLVTSRQRTKVQLDYNKLMPAKKLSSGRDSHLMAPKHWLMRIF